MVALTRGQTVGNFLVAFEAFERRRAGSKLMAAVALGRAVQGLVRFRERSGRNLGAGAGGKEQESTENQKGDETATHRRGDDAGTAARCICKEKRHQHPPANLS